MGVARGRVALALALLAIARPSAGPAQEPEKGASLSERLSVDYVLVPAVVSGRKGPVEDLPREAFELLVDGQPVGIESFESDDAPVSLFFLQDLSGSMELIGKLRSSRRVLDFFLDRAMPGDRFAMITFAGRRVETVVPLTHEVDLVREAAQGWHAYGTTALHDAVALLPDLIVDRPSARRAILLISDGLDNASDQTPSDARAHVRASEIPVYVIGLETGSPFELDSEGEKIYRHADVMNLLAHLTGGRYRSAFDEGEIDQASAAILDELRHQYILGFPSGEGGEVAPRSIEVRVNRKHVEVSHRRSYLGRPPRTPQP
jgi:Ca-activated chloride channel family protein